MSIYFYICLPNNRLKKLFYINVRSINYIFHIIISNSMHSLARVANRLFNMFTIFIRYLFLRNLLRNLFFFTRNLRSHNRLKCSIKSICVPLFLNTINIVLSAIPLLFSLSKFLNKAAIILILSSVYKLLIFNTVLTIDI